MDASDLSNYIDISGNPDDGQFMAALIRAIDDDDATTLRALLREPKAANALHQSDAYGRFTVMSHAIHKQSIPLVKECIDAGADVNAGYVPPLLLAIDYKNTALCKLLLAAGSDPNNRNAVPQAGCWYGYNTHDLPTYKAIFKGSVEILQCLLDANGVIPNPNGALSYAIPIEREIDNTSMLQYLLDLNIDVNATDIKKRTVLHEIYTYTNDYPVFETLLAAGADVNAKDCHGYTPLHFAVGRSNAAACKRLIAANADVNAVADGGCTPLHYSTYFDDNCCIIQMLIDARADVNCVDYDGETPLHIAVRAVRINTAELLLSAGADRHIQNRDGETARDIDHLRQIKALHVHMAKNANAVV